MEHARFWSTIDAANGNAKALVRALARLPSADIVAFDAWFWAYYMATRREDLWAAVYAIRGGCGDDSFDYFRGWLIGRGEATLLAAIRDPESLADIVDRSSSNEAMLGAARLAYRQVAAGELPDSELVEIPGRADWPTDRIESGLKWTDDFFAQLYPKLYARFIEPNRVEEPSGAITHDRFWEIIASAPIALDALSTEELVGFRRWLSTYNQALMRNDVRAAARVLLGDDSAETAYALRGWLIGEGRVVVEAAMHDIDSIQGSGRGDVPIMSTTRVLERRGVYFRDDTQETIPGRDTWVADWTDHACTVALLRERMPRLTANRTDEELTGPVNAAMLTTYERQQRAEQLLARAKGYASGDHVQAAMPLFDDAVRLWPGNAELLSARGRSHLTLGNQDAALADFDAALAVAPHAQAVRWQRAKLRDARGDRAGAIDDARRIADRIPEAKTWLAVIEQRAPTPENAKRVRHAKFGEGTVVSAADGKLVIDFPSGRKTLATGFVEVIE